MYVHHVHAWHPQRSEKGIKCPGTGVIDGCDPSAAVLKIPS
ncbi:rCG58865 [Rattus norvegicus]|uniref:RCG58865 n=1 Tax=Rattus norvegicus TaxID=10116 RepID=A6KRK0_RAT|nr:rCG58865 [Rattus norvegicus]